MKVLKVVAILIVIPFIAVLFAKKEFTVEREVVINKPKQEVFNYIKFLRNKEHYSKWATIDAKMKIRFRGTDGTVGFISVWESDNKEVGKSEQEIKKITEGERIDVEIRFTEPFQSTDPAYMTTERAAENQTKVKWGYRGKMNYPTNLMIFFIREKIGKDLETGLTNLKTVLEKQ